MAKCWQPGEVGAHARLKRFLKHGLANYKHARDRPAMDGTSGLSPHLHFGEIGPRQIWHALGPKGRASTFLHELIWREFYLQVLHNFPHVMKGSFRADLLARLAGFRLRLPPLWQRREDIGLLVARLLAARRGELAPELRFEPEAARRLFGYHWPLNIRELDNCLRAATVLARGGAIGEQHLPEQLRSAPEPRSSLPPPELSEADREQRDQLIVLFREHRGNVSAVARHMGKARTQVQRWLKRYQLDPRDYLE